MKNTKKQEVASAITHKSDTKDTVEIPVGKYLGKVRTNPWIASTVVLGLVLILVLVFGGGVGGKEVSPDKAGEMVVSYLNSNPAIGGGVELVSVKKNGQFHEITLKYQGQTVPVFTTLDGAFLVGNPVALDGSDSTNTETDNTQNNNQVQADSTVPKSDKPKVELFVMSHCPFGTQVEKGILPVVNTLGDKIDFEIKFVNYAMHGDKEVYEQLDQYCIQKEQPAVYLEYLKCFLEAGDSEGCQTTAKVNKVKLEACTKKADTQFSITKNFDDQASWLSGRFPKFMIHDAENQKYGVQGSPTLVVNGKEASSGRDPASLLATICNAFNTAPAECDTELSSAAPGPGFGWSTTSGDSAALAQCG